jgi:hypothetical protein
MKFHKINQSDPRRRGATRTAWHMYTEVDQRRYEAMAQKMVGTHSWVVSVKDTQTGEVLMSDSPGRPGNKAVMTELVQRLHEKARRRNRARGLHDRG